MDAPLPLLAARIRLEQIALGRIPPPHWTRVPSRFHKSRKRRQSDDQRLYQYGLSSYDFDCLVQAAMGRCGICGRTAIWGKFTPPMYRVVARSKPSTYKTKKQNAEPWDAITPAGFAQAFYEANP